MAHIDIRNFGGIVPALSPRALSPDAATVASNVNPKLTELRPVLDSTSYLTALSVSNPRTIHRLARTAAGAYNDDPASGWKAYAAHTYLAKWPQNDNNTERTTVSSATGAYAPRVIDAVGQDRLLGVPPPSKPVITVARGNYFSQESRDGVVSAAKADIVASLVAGLARAKIGATYTASATPGILESGAEVADPPVLTRSRVHAYSGFEGTIVDAYGTTVEADVAWVRTSGVGEWAQGTGTPAWYTAATWHYQVPYYAYGAGYKYTAATAIAALQALTVHMSYVVPTAPFNSTDDDFWTSVVGLLHFDGADQSTTITDSAATPKVYTANGNARIRTDVSAFGGSALYCDGVGDYVSTPNHADFNFPGQFCIEGRVYFETVAGTQAIISNWQNATNGWSLQLVSGKLTFNATGDGIDLQGTTTLVAGTIYYWRVSRNAAGLMELRLDSHLEATATIATAITSTAILAIGRMGGSATNFFTGYQEEIRITKGVNRADEPLLTAAQVAEISQRCADVFDPDGRFANPFVQPLRTAVTAFEAAINTRPQGSRTAAATATARTAAIEAAANAIYDALQRNAGVYELGSTGP